MLESFKADLSHQQENAPEGKKAKAKDLEEYRVRTEYLRHEVLTLLFFFFLNAKKYQLID